ncbi:MAG: 3-hydroxyacyl-CoA dehydrogenase NAD-binding domain-containing protein [Acidobacteriota bacterium]|jgi:3-hydroxybutyryl-CoA dehydrogenase
MSRPIETIAVLGAGTMGRGIAHVSALAGYETRLTDVSRDILDRARRTIEKNLDKGISLGKVESVDAEAALDRLTLHDDLGEAVSAADLVIEAVPETIALKLETFRRVEDAAPDHALFATNTSGLSVTEIAAATARPDRFAGMHFFNPVHIMKLVEMVRGLETSDETLQTLTHVAHAMGKKVVTVNESPGFVTSRVNAMIGNEAFRMLEQGIASAEDIDAALKLGLNHPMGPFEMVDLVGLDVRLSILRYLHETLGETYRPSRLLVQYVQAGRLGKKVGRGVYEYDEDGQRV